MGRQERRGREEIGVEIGEIQTVLGEIDLTLTLVPNDLHEPVYTSFVLAEQGLKPQPYRPPISTGTATMSRSGPTAQPSSRARTKVKIGRLPTAVKLRSGLAGSMRAG